MSEVKMFISMSNWSGNEQPAAEVVNVSVNLLCEVNIKIEEESADEDEEIIDNEGEVWERVSSPEPANSPRPSTARDRSRSPIREKFSSESSDGSDAEIDDDAILSPDAHALFVSPETVRDRTKREDNDSRRRPRRARGQSVGGHGYSKWCHRGDSQSGLGHPLIEIWKKAEDVPLELRQQMRMQGATKAGRNNEQKDDSESKIGNEFLDVNVGAGSQLRLEGQNFEWSTMESFQGREENFSPERTGSVHVLNSPYHAFRSYWSDDILELIVAETNSYATKIFSDGFQPDWYPTNTHEILCLFSFWIMLGIVRMPTIASCFSDDPLLKTEVFRQIFTQKRYEMLSRAIHFVDSDRVVNNPHRSNNIAASSSDQLYRLRPIIAHLNSSFQANYIMHKDIFIDESSLWKGRLKSGQYIKTKASKFCIKTFELCESSTGYLWSFIVDSSKQSATDLEQAQSILKSTAIVMKLISPLLNKGYRLFMDNWYISDARFLKLNGIDCVGTLRSSCRDVPIIINKAPLNRGEYIARHSGDVSILSWQDKKRVTMISTCHGSSTALPTVPSRPSFRPLQFKPQVVLDYNKFIGSTLDMKSQMLEPYTIEKKQDTKWYIKLFKRLLNVSIFNSLILLESCTHKRHHYLTFRLDLVDAILINHLSHCPQTPKFTVPSSRSMFPPPPVIINSTHWPVLLERTASTAARNRNFWKRCVVCLREGRKTQKTPYSCETCLVPLCIKNCFKAYHTPPYINSQ